MPQFAKWRPQRFLPVSVSISVYLYLYVFLCVQRVLLNDFQLNLILFFSLFFFCASHSNLGQQRISS